MKVQVTARCNGGMGKAGPEAYLASQQLKTTKEFKLIVNDLLVAPFLNLILTSPN
jgi:hypothetical protein